MLVLCLSFAIALLDQATKHVVMRRLVVHEQISVIPGFFSLRYVRNTGAAWGMLQGSNTLLVGASILMLLVIVFCRKYFLSNSVVSRVAMGLMLGGIVGNLVDRLRLGFVVDFFDFYWKTSHFPAFNLADSAICVGVGLYILQQLRAARRARAQTA